MLYASATVTPTAATATVDLKYNHAFSLVQVELTGDKAKSDAVVTLKNVKTAGTIDLTAATPNVALTGEAGGVKMKACSTNGTDAPYRFRAVVPAQTIQAGDAILTVSSGGVEYTYTYSVDVPYNQGMARQYNVKLGATAAECTIQVVNSDIANWGDDDALSGEGSVTEDAPGLLDLSSADWFNTCSSNREGAAYDSENGVYVVKFAEGESNATVTWENFAETLDVDNYPIFAFKLSNINGADGVWYNNKVEIWNEAGVVNTFELANKQKINDTEYIVYIDLSAATKEGFAKSGQYKTKKMNIKIDRLKEGLIIDSYNVHWLKTFKSVDAMKETLGITE